MPIGGDGGDSLLFPDGSPDGTPADGGLRLGGARDAGGAPGGGGPTTPCAREGDAGRHRGGDGEGEGDGECFAILAGVGVTAVAATATTFLSLCSPTIFADGGGARGGDIGPLTGPAPLIDPGGGCEGGVGGGRDGGGVDGTRDGGGVAGTLIDRESRAAGGGARGGAIFCSLRAPGLGGGRPDGGTTAFCSTTPGRCMVGRPFLRVG